MQSGDAVAIASELLNAMVNHAVGAKASVPLFLDGKWQPTWPLLEPKQPDCSLTVVDGVVDQSIV